MARRGKRGALVQCAPAPRRAFVGVARIRRRIITARVNIYCLKG